MWNNGSVQSQRWKSQLQKLRDERVEEENMHTAFFGADALF